MTTVVNKYKVSMSDSDIVYIGRGNGSIWGNPFVMKDKSDSERTRVVDAYKKYLWAAICERAVTKEMLLELDGKSLCCYCSPKACHGDVIVAAIEWAKGEVNDT